jgi:ankyrin repeat protein
MMVNPMDSSNKTALSLAAQNGYAEASELLLNAGADVEAQADDGWTPLILAAEGGHVECREVTAECWGQRRSSG